MEVLTMNKSMKIMCLVLAIIMIVTTVAGILASVIG